MRNYSLLLFVLSLPILAALGHDLWLAYNNTAYEYAERFFLSDFGWVLQSYTPETLEIMKMSFEKTTWENYVDPILEQKTVFVAAAPLVIGLVVIVISKIFGLGSFEGHGIFTPRVARGKKSDFTFENSASSSKRIKYKRK